MKLFLTKKSEIISNQWILERKIYCIEQNHTQKAFMISKLNKSAFVKRFSSIRFHPTIKFNGSVTLDCARAYLAFRLIANSDQR